MKTLYSSTFLSAILGFLMILNQNGKPITLVTDQEKPVFKTIFKQDFKVTVPNDKVYVEVFNGWTCEGCQVFGQGVLKELQKNYGQDPKVNFRLNLVTDEGNASEILATKTAYCAEKQSRFWEVVYELYNLPTLDQKNIDQMLEAKEWLTEDLKNCITGEEMKPKLDESRTKMENEKMDTLPGVIVNNIFLKGVQPIENIEREIRRALKTLDLNQTRQSL